MESVALRQIGTVGDGHPSPGVGRRGCIPITQHPDFAALTIDGSEGCSDTDQHADNHEQENDKNQRDLLLGSKKETQNDDIVILDGEAEKQQKQKES